MKNVRRLLLVAAAVLLVRVVPVYAQYNLGTELVDNQTFTRSAGDGGEIAAKWRFWPQGTQAAHLEVMPDGDTAIRVTGTQAQPLVGVIQTVPVNGDVHLSFSVRVRTFGPVYDVPSADPNVFHGGIGLQAKQTFCDGSVRWGTYYPFYANGGQDTVIGFSGFPGCVRNIELIMGVFQGVGSVTFSTPSVKAFPKQGVGFVTLQFDDGYDSVFTEAYPRLAQAGYVGSLAIATGWLNTPGFLTTSQLRFLSGKKWDTLSHSHGHDNFVELLANSGPGAVRREITMSARSLERILGLPIYHFAAPFGAQNGETQAIVEEEYDSQRDFFQSLNHPGVFPKMVNVSKIMRATTTAEVDSILAAVEQGAWGLLVMHSISNSPGEFDITPAQLDYLVTAIRYRGIEVLNYEDALGRYSACPVPKQFDRRIDGGRPALRRSVKDRWLEGWWLMFPWNRDMIIRPSGRMIEN